MSSEHFKQNCNRVYEIYGIAESERDKYSIHHIVFKRDVKSDPRGWRGFKVDEMSNLYPLKRCDHARLHRKVDGMEDFRQERHERRRSHRRFSRRRRR